MVATTTDPQRLRTHVEALSTTFVPRDWRHIDNLDRTATYISQALAAAGTEVSEQPYPMQANNENHGKTYRNVVGKLGPDTQDRIVVGAHYDAFGEYPGADDNASGVAALIEVARLLAKETLPLGVDLIAYSVEEPFTKDARGNFRTPDGGSAIHAASLKRAGARVRLMFSLETLGYFDDAPGSQDFPVSFLRYFYPSRGNYVLIVSNFGSALMARQVKKAMQAASPLPVYSISAPASVEGIDYSDHANYWANGYRAVMITDTAFNRNKNYHTAGDTADRLDYGRMASVVQGVYEAVLAVSQ
jgi:Zn-dependent M28 family amino/carboxypeptidase